MKNIHILPTDKPSNIGYYTDIKDTRLYILSNGNKIGNYKNNWNPQNIYITSDEKIKEGEYYIHGNRLHKHLGKTCLDVLSNKEYPQSRFINKDSVFKKIILTTDQDLIKNGVQAIPDEFLEWFVRNPSCEFINVVTHYPTIDDEGDYSLSKQYYTLNIPKEEPKQETLDEIAEKLKGKELFKESNDRARKLLSEIKLLPIAETLEEYIKRETKSIIEPSLRASAITFLRYGAKWQQKQDKNKFSDEEMKNTIQIVFELTNKGYSVDEIFEQFKKK